MRSLSYLSKLTIFGFLLSTLPVLFIGTFAYVTSSKEIKQNVNQSNLQLLMQINSNVEQKLITVNHTFNQVLNSTVLKKAMNQQLSADQFMLYDDLRNELRHMQSFDTKLEDVVLINERYNWMIKNSGLYPYEQYPYNEQLSELLESPENSFWTLLPAEWFYSEEQGRGGAACGNVISLVKKLPASGLDKHGLAFANITTCQLEQLLESKDSQHSTMMVLDDQQRILLHPNAALIGKTVTASGLSEQSWDKSSNQFQATIDHKEYSVSYLRSELNGWVYVSITSMSSIMKHSNKIGLYTLYICLIMLALSMLIAWLVSRRMYSPIQLLLNQIGERFTDIKARKTDEFQAIGERVHYLFQSKHKLEQEMSQHIQQVSIFYLMKALQSSVKEQDMTVKLRQFGYGEQVDSWKSMAVITMQIDFLEESRYSKNDLDLLLFAAHNIIDELIPSSQRLESVIMDQTVIIIFGSSQSDAALFHNEIYAVTEHLQQQISAVLSVQTSLGLSLPFHSFSQISTAYREGLEALKQRIKLGHGIIIQYENVAADKANLQLNYPSHLENELFDAIKLSEQEHAYDLLKQLLQTVFSAELLPHEYQIPLSRLLNNIIIMMQESGISVSHVYSGSSSLPEQLLRLQTKTEIEEWFRASIMEPLIHIFKDRQEAQYHNISEKIIDLVQHHYDTDLTLEECASRLHYNANYLSSVFRKETSHSFSEYLSMYRFKMARQWLVETDLPIKDIAARLRYNNPQNFIRSFRKQEGITPGQYREKKRG
ncbi:AraC family transcriptional regulator [Paenibacillus sp. IITD108]|uniref:AraC family transcriptional regulator n=1 Tax=Paenibacillus sp. IITD108 TaxID=3116649 RepID=UPI002F40ED42